MSFNYSVILSAGNGVRMKPITNYIPKALVTVNDTPLIEYVLNFLDGTKKYLTYGHKSEHLFTHTKDNVDGYINTTNKDNSYFLYNSFVKELNEPIIVSPCDMIIDIDLDVLYDDYIKLGSPAVMVVGVEPISGVEGDFINYSIDNLITGLSRENKTEIYCSGLQIINPYKINKITNESHNFYGVWKQLMELKELKVSNIRPNKWACYDNIEQIRN